LKLPICRFRLPFYPIEKARFILPFEEDYQEKLLKKAEKDFSQIRKFILRMTYDANLEDSPNWDKFKEMSFESFLYECGMYDGLESNENQLEDATERYVNA
jgi:hypothetical protein